MANKVTAHSKIKVIRSEITVQTKELKNCYQNIYIKMKCNTVYSPYVTASIEITYNCLKRLEKALCAAQQAATAIAGLTSKVPENTVSFSISPNRGSYPIDITVSDARACLDKMCNCKSAFDKISAGLDSCKSEISNLPVEDQTLNSVSVIETVFTGMYHGIFGGGSKVEIVKKAKQAFVNTMADAARIINELNAAITEFASKNGKLSKLLDEFETCEDKAFRQYEENFAKKYIDKTKQYTDSSLPDEAQLDNEITGLENAKNMLNSITCEECKDFDEEINRLRILYNNHYVAVTLTPNMEGHSMKQVDYALPNKGENSGCCATSYAMGMSIINGRYYNPENAFDGTGAVYTWGGVDYNYNHCNGNTSPDQFKQIYDKLKNGKPILFQYRYFDVKTKTNKFHWVLINGINKGANYNDLKYIDFKILDPGAGETQKNFGDLVNSTTEFYADGYNCFI